MDRIPSTQEVTCQLRKTRAKIRLKNAQLEGLLDYTSAGYNPQTLDYHQSMVHGLVHRLSTLENNLSSLELIIKDYVSVIFCFLDEKFFFGITSESAFLHAYCILWNSVRLFKEVFSRGIIYMLFLFLFFNVFYRSLLLKCQKETVKVFL